MIALSAIPISGQYVISGIDSSGQYYTLYDYGTYRIYNYGSYQIYDYGLKRFICLGGYTGYWEYWNGWEWVQWYNYNTNIQPNNRLEDLHPSEEAYQEYLDTIDFINEIKLKNSKIDVTLDEQ